MDKQSISCQRLGLGRGVDCPETDKGFFVCETVVVVTWNNAFVKTHKMVVYQKIVNYTVCKLKVQ